MNSIAIPVVAYALCAVIVVVRLAGRTKTLGRLGQNLEILSRRISPLFFLIIPCGLVLIGLLLIRDFGLLVNVVLAGSGILAVEMSMRDIVLRSISGVYENGISADGKLLFRNQIESLPTLEYEQGQADDDGDGSGKKNMDSEKQYLKVVTDSGVIFLRFASVREREAAAGIMKTWI